MVNRPLRVIILSSRSSVVHFFFKSSHTFLLHTKMMNMNRPVRMLMMSVGIQIQSAVTPPAAKEMISIVQETPIKMNKLKITRNL